MAPCWAALHAADARTVAPATPAANRSRQADVVSDIDTPQDVLEDDGEVVKGGVVNVAAVLGEEGEERRTASVAGRPVFARSCPCASGSSPTGRAYPVPVR
ncbi:hypothetical protein GCM10023196_042000 [Actinoallomurus vinaceus]|uniref:Uncharacterized protein n=1 Tax=Actinoallomurus vinaceus TaxID=1080074 RepID=A0ABP8UC86_9ACTN